jgi:uncharacterized protein (DUF2062 family)
MPKRWLQKYIPTRDWIMQQKTLRIFGSWLHDPNLWHLNRRSVAGAAAIGLFSAILPIPGQTVPAALGALLFRCNLPVALALTWISNPLTMGPFLYVQYHLGAWLMHTPPLKLEFNYDAFSAAFGTIWKPFCVGSIVFGTLLGMIGYLLVHAGWRAQVKHALRARSRRRSNRSGI